MKKYIITLVICACLFLANNLLARSYTGENVPGARLDENLPVLTMDNAPRSLTSGVVSVAYADVVAEDTSQKEAVEEEEAEKEKEPAFEPVVIEREVFTYYGGGRRDPFVSLLTSGELRPLISDVRLTTIAFDPEGQTSVAVLRNVETGEQYRVQIGSTLGRMRVALIEPRSVTFSINEFGYSRNETLTLNDSSSNGAPQGSSAAGRQGAL